jgi:hypothetical protein
MKKLTSNITAFAAALSLTALAATSSCANEVTRADIDNRWNSADMCAVDDGKKQTFQNVSSVLQCFDLVRNAGNYTETSGQAYKNGEIVADFSCDVAAVHLRNCVDRNETAVEPSQP